MTKSSSTGAGSCRSLVYGLNLLKLFTAEHPVRGIAELAEQMDVSRPTAHRYATTYLELGYLEQAPMRQYRLTRRAAEPGAAMIDALRIARHARPLLRALREGTGRTVGLAVLDDMNVLYLLRMRGFERGQYELERGLGAGSRRPAHRTAAGRALHGVERSAFKPQVGSIEFTIGSDEARKGARELAIPVTASGFKTSAIEVIAPADAERVELFSELEEPLSQAAFSLQQALVCDSVREAPPEHQPCS